VLVVTPRPGLIAEYCRNPYSLILAISKK